MAQTTGPSRNVPSFFISYSHADQTLAVALEAALVKAGASVWRDETALAVGDSLSGRIPEAIFDAEYMVVLVSETSTESQWCKRELEIAVAHGINAGRVKVMPLRVGDATLPPSIADLLWLPLEESTVRKTAKKLMQAALKHRLDPSYHHERSQVPSSVVGAARALLDELEFLLRSITEPIGIWTEAAVVDALKFPPSWQHARTTFASGLDLASWTKISNSMAAIELTHEHLLNIARVPPDNVLSKTSKVSLTYDLLPPIRDLALLLVPIAEMRTPHLVFFTQFAIDAARRALGRAMLTDPVSEDIRKSPVEDETGAPLELVRIKFDIKRSEP